MNILKSKQIWQGLAILAIIIASIILLFLPDVIENRYPYSYDRIQTERQNVESLNNELMSNESTIQSSIARVEEAERQERETAEREFEVRKGIIEEDFELHIPSVLIDLEQNAIANDVELTIGYNSMTTTASESMPGGPQFGPGNDEFDEFDEYEYNEEFEDDFGNDDFQDDFDEFDEFDENIGGEEFEDVSAQEGISITEDVNEEPMDEEIMEDSVEEDSADQGEQETNELQQTTSTPNIEGINVNTIPLNISGTFFNVRSYIRYLDEVGMIEPSSVVIQSEGRNVTASIIINIFHGEVD